MYLRNTFISLLGIMAQELQYNTKENGDISNGKKKKDQRNSLEDTAFEISILKNE